MMPCYGYFLSLRYFIMLFIAMPCRDMFIALRRVTLLLPLLLFIFFFRAFFLFD